MKRIQVDFNTIASEPIDVIKFGTRQEREELPRLGLQAGERVLLFDGEGLEGEAILSRTGSDAWMADPDPATWRDTGPQASPRPSLGEQEPVG
jgi:hypothetical protein